MSTKAAQIREGDVEIPDAELPEGWISIRLEQHVYIAGRIGWRGLKAEEYTAVGPILLSVPNLNYGDAVDFRHVNHISVARYQESPEIQVRPGDILLVKDGAGIGKLGYVATLPADATVNSSLLLVRPQDRLIYAKYLFYYFKGPDFQSIALNRITGSATPHLFQKDIKQFQILVAPLDEQYRIAKRIETLSGEVENARTRLSKLPLLIKHFRQAVLAAACSGKLTEDWRGQNAKSHGAAEILLSNISEKRRALMKGRQKAGPAEPDTFPLQDAPAEWCITSIDALTCSITSGSRDWKQYYREGGPGTFVMAQNVRPLRFDRTYRLAIAPPRNSPDAARSEIQKGDLLITIVGANTGDVCLVSEHLEKHYVCQSVALIRPIDDRTSKFIELYLNSPLHGQAQYREWIYGEGRPHLSFDHLRETAIALPGLDEQQEIVRRVEALFKLSDAIEKRVLAATLRTERLTQAILAKAFRGELVSTEAELARIEERDYESASALLERIKATAGKTSAGSVNGKKLSRSART